MNHETITLTHPTTDTEYTINADIVIQCEHCNNTWGSQAESTRPTCPNCQRKTDRNNKGYHYSLVTRYDALSGDNNAIEYEEAYARLNEIKHKLEAFQHANWTIDSHGGQGTFFLSSPDAPPYDAVE